MTTYCESCGCSLSLGGPVCGECMVDMDMADESGEDMVTRHMAGADDLSDDIEF